MGPRSDNRGYGRSSRGYSPGGVTLQWVHGLITVVMENKVNKKDALAELQWVHGLITVVMHQQALSFHGKALKLQWVHGLITVVMGAIGASKRDLVSLQWVHGLITVVMTAQPCLLDPHRDALQWVHGLITVVMYGDAGSYFDDSGASMGPRSDNRGYVNWLPVAGVF